MFMRGTSVTLLLTGVAKLLSLANSRGIVESTEPLTQLPWGIVILPAGLWELALGAAAWRVYPLHRNLLLVAETATILLSYRIGIWLMGINHPCPCLGHIEVWMLFPPGATDTILTTMLTCWLAGALIYLVVGFESES